MQELRYVDTTADKTDQNRVAAGYTVTETQKAAK
jgi:hypothetical protein